MTSAPSPAELDARFRAVADSSLDAVTRLACVRDGSGAIVDFVLMGANARAARRNARPGEALVGRRFSELFPFAEMRAHFARLVEVAETGTPVAYELRVRDPAFKVEWVFVRTVRFGDGVLSTSRDVTESKRAAEVSDLYRTLLRSMREGLMLVRLADASILYVNRRLEQLFGYAPGELDGRDAGSLVAPGWDAAPVVAALEARGEASYEIESVRKDGARFTAHATTARLEHGAYGTVWVTVLEDITERRRAEEARARGERVVQRLAAIVESSADAIVSGDANATIQSWNRGAAQLYGYTSEEAIGRSAAMLMLPDQQGDLDDFVQRLRRGETLPAHDRRRRRKDGSTVEVSLSHSPIRGDDGSMIGISTIARDISATKSVERQITAALREKEVLLQEVHHRVKNNLQVVLSLLKLQAGRIADPRARAMFEESRGRVRAIALLHETLYRSRDFGRVALAGYLRGLVHQLHRMYGAAGERVQVTIGDSDVALALDAAVPCGLIVNELLTNAYKHAFPPSRGGGGRIAIAASRRGDAVELTVSDDGIGLPEGYDFAQARSLGMHLVRTLARQLHGTATFTGGAGVRCVLTFTDAEPRGGPAGT